jgi:hypothetical protein
VRDVGRKIEETDPQHLGEDRLSLLRPNVNRHTNRRLFRRATINFAGQRLTRERPVSSVEPMELIAMCVFPHELKI